jgi:hypothetical protein
MIMNEMYWITRLDGLLIAIVVPMAILLFIATLSAVSYFDFTYASDDERKGYRKRAITCGSIGFLLLIVQAFIPTTNQALIIYGVGGTIDYVKSSDKAKQLPEKAIMALDKYLESINEDK